MIRITNGCDWTERFGEVKDVGFEGIRINTTEIAYLFPNKPVFKSVETRNYLYDVDWTSTASGVNRFENTQWGQGGATFKSNLQAAKAQNLYVVIHFNFNGYGGNWATPNYNFSYSTQTITVNGTFNAGAVSINVNATSLAVPAGSVLCFCRGGSGFIGTAYVKTAASSGATSIETWYLNSTVLSGDIIAVIRNGSYIGTINANATSYSTGTDNTATIAVSSTGFNLSANDTLLIYRGGTIQTTTTVQTRASAGATTLSVSALGAGVTTGDFCNIPDAPTSVEPYGYRSPNPSDAQANTDAALAMMAYILNDPAILYPPELVIMEEWNEPDQRVFGGQGFPGTSGGGYGHGWGFFSYPVKYLQSVRVPQVRAAFPNIPYISSSFSFGFSTDSCSVRQENFVTAGIAQENGIDAYWNDFTGINMHDYVSTKDGSKNSAAKRLYLDIKSARDGIDTHAAILSSLPWYMTEIGIRPNLHTQYKVPNSDRYNGEMLLLTHDVCRAMGFALWGNYCYHFRSSATYQITASGTSAQGATSVGVSATGVTLPVGTVLFFGTQGAKVTLTSTANQGATSLACEALPTAISNNDKSWYQLRSDNEFYHMIPDMTTRNSLFIGVDDPQGKNDKFWVFAERFARVALPASPEPVPET